MSHRRAVAPIVALCLLCADAQAQSKNEVATTTDSLLATTEDPEGVTIGLLVGLGLATIALLIVWSVDSSRPGKGPKKETAMLSFLKLHAVPLRAQLATGRGPLIDGLASLIGLRAEGEECFRAAVQKERARLARLIDPTAIDAERATAFEGAVRSLAGPCREAAEHRHRVDEAVRAGLAAVEVGHHVRARERLSQALEGLLPDETVKVETLVAVVRGRLQTDRALREHERAEQELLDVLTAVPSRQEIRRPLLIELGLLRWSRDDTRAAIASFSAAEGGDGVPQVLTELQGGSPEHTPGLARLRLVRAEQLTERGQRQRALVLATVLTKAATATPETRLAALSLIARTTASLGRLRRAAKTWQQVVGQSSSRGDPAQAGVAWGQTLLELGDHPGARIALDAAVQQAIAQNRTRSRALRAALDAHADLCQREGLSAGAALYTEWADALAAHESDGVPGDEAARRGLLRGREALNRSAITDALGQLEGALAHAKAWYGPSHGALAPIHRRIGDAHLVVRDAARAGTAYRLALTVSEHFYGDGLETARALRALARFHEQAGDRDQAARALERATAMLGGREPSTPPASGPGLAPAPPPERRVAVDTLALGDVTVGCQVVREAPPGAPPTRALMQSLGAFCRSAGELGSRNPRANEVFLAALHLLRAGKVESACYHYRGSKGAGWGTRARQHLAKQCDARPGSP